MAEKAFKVPSLALVGTDAELDFASGDLRWNALPLATESYVDTAVGNVTVNVEALAGDNLAYDSANNELDVNTNAVAQSLVGEGLYVTNGDDLAVNTNLIATRDYVDGVASGLDVKQSVYTATTGNITLSGEGQKEDGQSYMSGERVLVKDQTTASENGIYVVNKLGAWTRSTDTDTELTLGAFTFVETGTNAGKGFVYSAINTWTQFSEAGSFITSLAADSALRVTNGVLDIALANTLYETGGVSSSLAVNTNTVGSALAGNGISYDSDGAHLDVDLDSSTGALFFRSDKIAVNVNALAGRGLIGTDWTQTGLLKVNVNTLAGNGLGQSTNLYGANSAGYDLLFVNTNSLATELAGSGLFVTSGDNVNVNTNALATSMAGSGLYYAGVGQMAVNTNVIATREYVDAVAEGLHIHEAVKAATTTNVALASALEAGDTLDGVTLVAGDRILVKNQSTKSENGIYVVQASGQPVRATDFDTATEVDSGDFVFVSQGTTLAATGWVQIATPATIGTDEISFAQFSGAGTYTGGDGLTLNGNTFSVNVGEGLYITSDNVTVNTNAVATSLVGEGLYVTAGDNLAVNINALAAAGLVTSASSPFSIINGDLQILLDSSLYIAGLVNGTLAVNTNALAEAMVGANLSIVSGDNLTVNTLALDNLTGVTSFALTSDGTRSNLFVNTATTETSNTYVQVGTIPAPATIGIQEPHMFEADVIITVGSKMRSSKLSGIRLADDSFEYTEYAIVESGGTIADVDVRIPDATGGGDAYIEIKAARDPGETIRGIVRGTTTGILV
jgi:hypothetical protein